MITTILGFLLVNFCSAQIIQLEKWKSKNEDVVSLEFISIKVPKISSKKRMIFFQLCFIPHYPIELPDEMWKTGYSNCYIIQKEDEVPKYTAIGIPIRLGPNEFAEEPLTSYLMQGNGIFEIEHFQHKADSETRTFTIVVRNTILLVGKFVAHLFEVTTTAKKTAEEFHHWMDLYDNDIRTLNTSEMEIKPQRQYCYVLPSQPEDDFSMPVFEDTENIKYLCDICWFDRHEPEFVIKIAQMTHNIPSEMTPHPAFRRYFGFIRIASLPQELLDVLATVAFLAISPGPEFDDVQFRVHRAASPPQIEAYVRVDENDRKSASQLGVIKMEEKERIAGSRFLEIFINPEIDTLVKPQIELLCKSKGIPEPKIQWQMDHETENITLSKVNSEMIIIEHPQREIKARIIRCSARNKIKGFIVHEVITVVINRQQYSKKAAKAEAQKTQHTNWESTTFNLFIFAALLFWFGIRATIFAMMDEDASDSQATDQSFSSAEEYEDEDHYF